MRKGKINEKIVNLMFRIMIFVSILVIGEGIFIWGKKYLGREINQNISIIFTTTSILFLVVLILTAVIQVVYWFQAAFSHLSGYQGAKCFENIDFLNRNFGESNEYYRSKLRKINKIYQNDSELQQIVDSTDLESLYARKAYLENQLDLFNNTIQPVGSFVLSFLAAIVEKTTGKDIVFEVICGIIVMVFLCMVILVKYIGKGRGGSYTYNIHEYELELLNEKIHLVNKKLQADEEIEKVLELRQTVVNVLADIYKSRRKKIKYKLKKKSIDNMVRTLFESPLLEFGDKESLIWGKIKIYGKECFFPVTIENGQYICINESYKAVKDIVDKVSVI